MSAGITIKQISVYVCKFPDDIPETSSHYKTTTLEAELSKFVKTKPSGVHRKKIVIPKTDFEILAEKFSEELTTNAIEDLKELVIWQKGTKEYPFLGKYIPLKIDRNELPEGSKSAKESLGSSMMGYIIELFPNIMPIVRNVGKFPDCICLSKRPNELVQFWEAKCRKGYKIKGELAKIYNELDRNHCDVVCIVNSKILKFHPLEVELEIYKCVLDKPKRKIKLSGIVSDLQGQIVSTAAANNTSAKEALTDLLGTTALADNDLDLDSYAVKKILAACDKKVKKEIGKEADLEVKSKSEVFNKGSIEYDLPSNKNDFPKDEPLEKNSLPKTITSIFGEL